MHHIHHGRPGDRTGRLPQNMAALWSTVCLAIGLLLALVTVLLRTQSSFFVPLELTAVCLVACAACCYRGGRLRQHSRLHWVLPFLVPVTVVMWMIAVAGHAMGKVIPSAATVQALWLPVVICAVGYTAAAFGAVRTSADSAEVP